MLSIVVPVHGVEAYLGACLDSILADQVSGMEVVVVDDRSPDRSGEIAEQYAAADARVRVVHLATNVGLGRARNTGLERAHGRYVWFVDGDDWLPAGAVAVVADRLATTGPDVLVVDHMEVYPDGRTRPGNRPGALAGVAEPGPLTQHPQLLGLAHSACTRVVRRDLLNEIDLRFDPGWYEDTAYTHRLMLAAPRIDVLDRACYCYRRRAAGCITGSVSVRHFDVFAQYDRLWAAVDRAGAYEPFRPELFRLMVDHLLVIAGNEQRVPARLRREFFHQTAQAYRRRRPAGGYPVPGGLAGFKHRLVRADAYSAYAGLRMAWRFMSAARHGRPLSDMAARTGFGRRARGAWRTARAPAAPAAAAAAAAAKRSGSTSGSR